MPNGSSKAKLGDADLLKLAASTFGRLGGLKGGKARAEKLTAERRSEIAQEGARARWSKKRKPR